MGLPEIRISFMEKANSAVSRSSRGMVALLLKDNTKDQYLTPLRRWRDVKKEDWTEGSLKAIELAFKAGPQRVLAVRIREVDGSTDLKGTLDGLLPLNMDYLAFPAFQAADRETVLAFLHQAHEAGKKVKAVLPDCAADDPHVINFATGSITARWEDAQNTVTYTAAEYCSRIAGILAGLPLTRSCTYYELAEVVDAQTEADPDTAVDAGKLIIIFDGEKYKLARGVTSLTTTSEERPEELKKIKIVEGMDVITHDIYSTYEDDYVGKVSNNYDSKQLFVGAVNEYLRKLEGSILNGSGDNHVEVDVEKNREWLEKKGTDTTEMTEQEIREADTGSWMFLSGSCRFLDASEDLDLTMYM